MNKKLGKVAAIALSAAMITSAFAMSTSASFAATAAPKAPVAATAQLTDATKTLYMDNTTSTKVTVTGQNGETGTSTNAPTSFGIASLTKKSDSTDVTSGAAYDFKNASIAKTSGDSVDLTKDAATGNFKYGFEANGKTGATVFTVSGVTASDAATGDNYAVDPFSFTVDSENKATFSKGVLLKSDDAVISDATVGDTLHVAEVYMTASQTSGTFAAIPLTDAKTLAPLGADTLSATPVTGSATITSGSPSTVAPTAAGSLAVAYKESADGKSTYKSTNTITVKQDMTLTAVTAVTKAANGGYDVTDSKGAEHYDDLTGYTLQLASSGATIGTDVVADTIDASQMTTGKLIINGASVKTITGVASGVELDVKATNLGKATSVGTVTTAGAVTIGSTSDKSTVAVDSVTESTTATPVVVTSNDVNDLASTTVKSIKADNVDVNSAKTSIGAIAANGTAGKVTTTVDGVSLPALTGYELDAQGNTTVASIDAATKDVKITNDKTLTVTGTAKVRYIRASTTTTPALDADTGTVKIGAGKLTLAPAADESTTATNIFKLVLSNAQPYGAAFTLSSAAGTDGAKTAVPVTPATGPATYTAGTDCLTNICIAGTQGFVNAGDTAVTLDTSITETGLNNACPTATKFTAGADSTHGSVDVENGSAVLAVEPTPLKTLPAGYSVKWEAANGYVNLSSTTGLSTTVSGAYDSFNTYKNTDTVTATMKNSAGTEVGRFTYTVKLQPASVATTSDFSVTAPATAIATDASGVFEIVANGATPINKANVTVSSDNQAVINDENTTLDPDGNNVKVTVLGSKAGTANLTFKWVDPSTGKTLTHTAVANVADEPVYAYVDGRVVNPTDTISIAQSTTKAITFITATGKKIDTFNYNAGNGKIMSTRAPASTVWNGVSGDYGMYMNGPVGSVTGVYVNNQKICNVKVADRPFTCDTTYNFNLKAGKTYEFKLTPAAGTTFDNFTFNTAKDAALSTNGYKKNADGTINAFVKAVQKGTYGVYVTINDVQYKVFAVTVD